MLTVKTKPKVAGDRMPFLQEVSPPVDLVRLLSDVERETNPRKKPVGKTTPAPLEGHMDALTNLARREESGEAAKAVFGEAAEHQFSAELWRRNTSLGRRLLHASLGVQARMAVGAALSADEQKLVLAMVSNPHVTDLINFAADELLARKKTQEFFDALDDLRKKGEQDPVYMDYLKKAPDYVRSGRIDELTKMPAGFSSGVQAALARVNGIFDSAATIDNDMNVGLEEQFSEVRTASEHGSQRPSVGDVVRAAMEDRLNVLPGYVEAMWGGEPPKDRASAPTHEEVMAKTASGKERFERLNDSLRRLGLPTFSLSEIAEATGEVGLRAYSRRDSANNVSFGESGGLRWSPSSGYSVRHEGDEASKVGPVLVSPMMYARIFNFDPRVGKSPQEIEKIRLEREEAREERETEARLLKKATLIKVRALAEGRKTGSIEDILIQLREREMMLNPFRRSEGFFGKAA